MTTRKEPNGKRYVGNLYCKQILFGVVLAADFSIFAGELSFRRPEVREGRT